MTKTPTRPRQRLRRALIALLIAVPVVGALVLPGALSSRAGRAWLLGRANRALAPGRLDLASLRFSWFGPTRITGLALYDARGTRLVAAPRATWDRNFGQVLFGRPRLGTFRLDGATIEARRRDDGSIDLYETLRPVIGRDDRTRIRVLIPDGRFRLRGRGIVEPVNVEHAAITIDVAGKPGPVRWTVRLADGPAASPGNTLDIDGSLRRGAKAAAASDELDLVVKGRAWPWALGGVGLAGSGRLDGGFRVRREAGRWRLSGDATLAGVEAVGRRLGGDTLRLGNVRGVWDLTETADGWEARQLAVNSPMATLNADGPLPGSGVTAGPARLDARLDLAALARQIPHALRLRPGVTLERGTAAVKVESTAGQGGVVVDVRARVSDLRASDEGRPFELRDPATLAARLRRRGDSFEVESVSAETPFLRGEAKGDLTRGVQLTGTIDLAGFQRQFRDLVDFGGADLAGKGRLSGSYRASAGAYHGQLGAALHGVRVAGLVASGIERDEVALDLVLDGGAGGSGLPSGWTSLGARLTSGDASAELTARSEGPRASVVVSAPAPLPGHTGRVAGRVGAAWDSRGITLDPVLLTLGPAEKGGPAPVSLAARGRFDRARGELTLTPAGDPSAVVRLGNEGLRVSGLGGGGGLRFDGGLGGEVAGLAGWASSAPEGLRGTWSARASARSGDDGLQVAGRVGVEGLAWGPVDGPAADPQPVGLAWRALLARGGGRVDLNEFVLTTRYATLEASGRVDDTGGRRVADLTGKFSPDWAALNGWLAARVEPGARVSGRPRAWRVRLPLGEGWRDEADGEFGVGLDGADVYGMRFGPADLILRARKGAIAIDPVDTTVNEGRLRLVPGYRGGDDPAGPAVVLKPGSTLRGARVNDEVSRRVLSFVAPILDNATRVRGQISADVKEAVFPVGGGSKAGPTVEGSVVFQDVVFVPGPLFEGLAGLTGQQEKTLLKLDKPVSLTIADRRVYQRGLTIPVGTLTQIGLDGWVGFDRELHLTASVPVLPTMLTDRPVLEGIAGAAKVQVPIRGTLQNPQIDREAFQAAMKDTGRSLIEGGLTQGAAALLERLIQGRDPNAPPPPPRLTPEERRERRLEQRAERRARRGLPP